MRTLIAVLFLALFAFPAQAECLPPDKMRQFLIGGGLIPYAHAMSDQHYILKIYVGDGRYVLTVEDQDISCIVSTGTDLYIQKGFRI